MQLSALCAALTPKRLRWLTTAFTLAGLLALTLGAAAPAFANVTGSDFESGDGNLTVDIAGDTDWNSFSPTWTGTAPYRQAVATANGWSFAGFEDAQKSNSDTGFAGGTKQDVNCAKVIGTSAPNKDDLKRIYLASKIAANGHVYLTLAWVRVPQQSVSSSAHVGFEFNQGSNGPCPAGSGGLVNRTAGDMLIVYDFNGGANAPAITIRRWVTSGACEVGADSPPCWGPASTDLITSGVAEAKVDFTTFPVSDTVAPGGATLGQSEFGEAGIDLTAANVFGAGQCQAFGQAEGVSRSSGNSGTAAMEDLDGPGPFSVTNCGTIKIHKKTIPAGGTGFSYTTTGASPLGGGFSLDDGGTQTFSDVPTGNYSVTESGKTGWDFVSLSCTPSGSGTSANTSGTTASITMGAGGNVDCTYTNHIHASPTVATTLSASTINTGDSVTDSATLTGATSDAGGTVTFTVYTDTACTSAVAGSSSTVNVTNGSVQNPSSPVQFNTAGTFYWQAAYSGDTHNDAAKSPCTSETLVVKTNPKVTTQLSATSVGIGVAVSDQAFLADATSDAGGTVTYSAYSDSGCTLNKQDAGTVTVTSGSVLPSNSISFSSAGTYYWQAVYSGDAKNNPASSVCTSEQVVVNKNTPGINTAQNVIPNDAATINGATSNAGGTITFNLYSPTDATCSGNPALTQTVNVNGNGTYTTTNSTFIASATGEWRWQVTYSGDSNNQGATSTCGVENFTITNG